jgi:cytochrome c oxidase subunit 2
VVIVLVLFVVSFIVLLDIEDDAEPGSLTVEVTGFRWQWAFAYDLGDLGEPSSLAPAEGTVRILGAPDDEPVLYLPVDEEIEFVLLASDVIHSFYIRDFLYKLDVVPGRENKFRVVTTDEGTYRGQCAEFCGTDHALMRFSIEVVSRAEFDDWISRQATAQGLIESPESLLANAD